MIKLNFNIINRLLIRFIEFHFQFVIILIIILTSEFPIAIPRLK